MGALCRKEGIVSEWESVAQFIVRAFKTWIIPSKGFNGDGSIMMRRESLEWQTRQKTAFEFCAPISQVWILLEGCLKVSTRWTEWTLLPSFQLLYQFSYQCGFFFEHITNDRWFSTTKFSLLPWVPWLQINWVVSYWHGRGDRGSCFTSWGDWCRKLEYALMISGA